jgi:hypothetical protein
MATQGFTNFPKGFAGGLNLRGMPLVQTQPGAVFWVSNASTLLVGQKSGSDGNKGTYDAPFSTLAGALTACTAGRGDIIFVKPGHAETISSASILSLNVAGVAIVGLGSGSNRPTLTFTTTTAANIPITAADMSIQNFLFKANFAAIVSVFTATSTNTPTDFAVERCEFRDGSSSLNFVAIVTGNATANSLDGLRFSGNRIASLGTTAATTAIKLSSANDRVSITDNFGNWAALDNTACMVAAGANSQTNFEFGRNVLNKPNLNSTTGSFISTSATAWTGHCYDNYLWQLDGSAGIWIDTGTKLAFSNNFSPITGAADKSGLINPAAA